MKFSVEREPKDLSPEELVDVFHNTQDTDQRKALRAELLKRLGVKEEKTKKAAQFPVGVGALVRKGKA